MASVLKTDVARERHRGFESHALRCEVFTFHPAPCSRPGLTAAGVAWCPPRRAVPGNGGGDFIHALRPHPAHIGRDHGHSVEKVTSHGALVPGLRRQLSTGRGLGVIVALRFGQQSMFC